MDEQKEFIDNAYDLESAYQDNTKTNIIPSRYGLCRTCACLVYVEYELGDVYTHCYQEGMSSLPNRGVVKKCSRYRKSGEMSLIEMGQMAYYIEAKERKIGFEVKK